LTDIVTIIETNNSKFQVQYSNLRSDFVTITEHLDSKLQAATANITATIQQNEKLSEKLIQKLHNEVEKPSSDICTSRYDTQRNFQEVIRTIGGVSDARNERIDAHVVATRKMRRISQKINARWGAYLIWRIGQRQ